MYSKVGKKRSLIPPKKKACMGFTEIVMLQSNGQNFFPVLLVNQGSFCTEEIERSSFEAPIKKSSENYYIASE